MSKRIGRTGQLLMHDVGGRVHYLCCMTREIVDGRCGVCDLGHLGVILLKGSCITRLFLRGRVYERYVVKISRCDAACGSIRTRFSEATSVSTFSALRFVP